MCFNPHWVIERNDHLQDNTGILHTPYDNVSMIAPLHTTCNPIKWEITHVNIEEFIITYPPRTEPDKSYQYTSEITNRYIHIYFNLSFDHILTFK
jgi:hypothetical protein